MKDLRIERGEVRAVTVEERINERFDRRDKKL